MHLTSPLDIISQGNLTCISNLNARPAHEHPNFCDVTQGADSALIIASVSKPFSIYGGNNRRIYARYTATDTGHK